MRARNGCWLKFFECSDDLFGSLPTVRKRVVLWGKGPAVTLPHSGVVVEECVLLEKLWHRVEKSSPDNACAADFTIQSVDSATNSKRQRFGSRRATATTVAIEQTAAQTCWIEALDNGWLFLLPSGELTSSLIAVGESAAALLDRSQLVGPQVESLVGPGATFDAYPQILDPLCGPDWLACGNAAMRFDPICGEGAGNAVREAILASAVIPAGAIDHYAARLLAGFARHLNVCRKFYRAACTGPWWEAELADLERGRAWVYERLSSAATPQYRLVDFDLEPLHVRAS